MIREGSPDVTLSHLSKNRNSLAISNFTDAVTQGKNIRHYANYLAERARAYRDTKTDWVRAPESRLESLTVEKGLLRQTETVQRQLAALLKCDVLDNEPENEITITVFRLLVLDLLALFQVLNQGLINILGHFFEMTKTDAERAMEVYRTFTRQTEYIVAYLSVARQHEHHTRVPVPRLKHAPIHLTRQLEDYLKDPDFEIHRRQYIAEQAAKGKRIGEGTGAEKFKGNTLEFPKTASSPPIPASNNPFPPSNGFPDAKPTGAVAESQPKANKGPEPDLIDFFESIEQNQTTMPVHPQPTVATQVNNTPFQTQPTGFQQDASFGLGFSTNPYQQQQAQQPQPFQQQPTGFFQQQQVQQQQPQFQPQPQPLQNTFTGAGFGGFSPQPQSPQGFQPGALGSIPQSTVASFQPQQGFQPMVTNGQQAGGLQPQSTNPFRQSMLMGQPTGLQSPPASNLSSPIGGGSPALSRQSTNPFARSPPISNTNSPFQSQPPQQQQQQPAPLQPAPTGTNPFARNTSPRNEAGRPQTAGGALAPQPTGTTNPFRQSAFVNHANGQGWQHNQQPIGGGLDQLPTQPVFPRPLQQTPWQQ
jgi:hypothetical protein